MRAGGPFPLFHLIQLFEYYLSPPILQSSLSRVFSHVLGVKMLFTSAYDVFYQSMREKPEEYGKNGIFVVDRKQMREVD